MAITAVILTKNEEDRIINCIESLNFCDQIIVVDDNSTDNTVEILKTYKNRAIDVLSRSLDKNFSAQRNFGLGKAKNEWVLFVDADEIISKNLAVEMLSATEKSEYLGYSIRRKDSFLGFPLQYGETGNVQFIRLAKKNAGKWEGSVHEKWIVNGKVGQLQKEIIHTSHKNISQFLQKLNIYSTLRAEELYAQKKKSNMFFILLYPLVKFIKNYFILQGYKDKTAGFVHAVFMSFHSFLVRGKLYLLWKGIRNTH
jgi:glycosyltransferase involved in cell wall biosynthesis